MDPAPLLGAPLLGAPFLGVDGVWLVALPVIAVVAGFVDALAGGGGLLTLPALLMAGLDPVTAIATNKAQGWFGPAAAAARFHRQGLLDSGALWPMVVTALLGAALGAWLVQRLDTRVLMHAVPLLLMAVAVWLVLAPGFGVTERPARLSRLRFALTIPPGIGLWDGLVGPGTGSFFALTLTELGGRGLLQATAQAKVLNLATNLSALAVFVVSGQVRWGLGLLMALGMALGGWLGAQAAIAGGARLIRLLLILVSTAMSIHLMSTWW